MFLFNAAERCFFLLEYKKMFLFNAAKRCSFLLDAKRCLLFTLLKKKMFIIYLMKNDVSYLLDVKGVSYLT